MSNINSEVINTIATELQERHGFATKGELDAAILEVLKKTETRKAKGNNFSLSTMIRGLRAQRGEPINAATASADVEYLKALTTGGTPGSYLVPTLQADELISFLNTGGVARASGVRIWPMDGIQKLNIPVGLSSPTWIWAAQNSQQTPSDPNMSQMAFDLKERRALVAVPNALLASSVPAFDTLLSEFLGIGAAEHEDAAFFASSTVSGGPTALMSAAGISTVNVGGSANGGNLAFTDLTAVLAKAAAVKAKGPFCWYASPRTFWQRIVGMIDTSSRPLFIPTLSQGLQQSAGNINVAPSGSLMGFPLYVTPNISEAEAYGSGTNQSHLVFTNPKYCHIGQSGAVEIAISTERFFDANQTAIRAVQYEDFGFAPAAGIVVLEGVN